MIVYFNILLYLSYFLKRFQAFYTPHKQSKLIFGRFFESYIRQLNELDNININQVYFSLFFDVIYILKLKSIFSFKNDMLVYLLAGYLYKFSLANHIICLVKISQKQLISQIQTEFILNFTAKFRKIDLTKPEIAPKFDISKLKYLGKLFN